MSAQDIKVPDLGSFQDVPVIDVLVQPGDVVEVEIAGFPALRNTVVDWDVDLSGPGDQPETSANTLHVALAIPEDEAERRVAAGEVD